MDRYCRLMIDMKRKRRAVKKGYKLKVAKPRQKRVRVFIHWNRWILNVKSISCSSVLFQSAASKFRERRSSRPLCRHDNSLAGVLVRN